MLKLLGKIVASVALLWVCSGALAAGQTATHSLTRAEMALTDATGRPTNWQPVSLPHASEETFPGYSGVVWYRLPLEVHAGAELPGVYIERACTNLEVFVNGELIGSGGLMADPVTRNCYYPQLFLVPRALLKSAGNEVRIKLLGFAARGSGAPAGWGAVGAGGWPAGAIAAAL